MSNFEIDKTLFFVIAIIICQSEHTVQVSKLFLWYGCDFGTGDEEVLKSISGFVGKSNPELARSIEEGSKLGYKVIYHDYDWSLNSLNL